ncbi:hypothetical protein LINPERHAP1_LOCUS13164, partial [Linum perenne]
MDAMKSELHALEKTQIWTMMPLLNGIDYNDTLTPIAKMTTI